MAVPVTAAEPPASGRSRPALRPAEAADACGNSFRGQALAGRAVRARRALVGLWFAAGGFLLFAAPRPGRRRPVRGAGSPRSAAACSCSAGCCCRWSSSASTRRSTRPGSRCCRCAAARWSPACSPPRWSACRRSATLLATLGLVVDRRRARRAGRPAGRPCVGVVVGLLLCVAASRAVTSAFATMLRSRRVRDLAAVLLARARRAARPVADLLVLAARSAAPTGTG